MNQLMELVQINHHFQKSVNLQLDLNDYERIGSYIPTRSSVAILDRYLDSITGKSSENSTILIGPYGKGKSHLLLVLLALLHGDKKEIEPIADKIRKVDETTAKRIDALKQADRRYLPVLVTASAGNDLNQSFIFALREALLRENIENTAPESSYSQALLVIENWKKNFPKTYQQLEVLLRDRNCGMKELLCELKLNNRKYLQIFTELYPALTSGSQFAPMIQSDALKVYQQVCRILTEEYGYAGIFLVFDEFSKYIEGHAVENFSNDMKTLQDICELCNNSRQQMFLTMVAHKSIREYTRGIEASVKNSFRGVEGRIQEIEFVVSAQNNYELIADTILKKEPEFSKQFKKFIQNNEFKQLFEESFALPFFEKNFQEKEFEEIISKGCFPMTPVCACALLLISEKVAQNERTIFTFLADEGQGSLSWLLSKGQKGFVGIDKIYDYFKALFRETSDQLQIHNEWSKAEAAINKAANDEEIQLIKAVAVIRMIHREDELPARDNVLRLALAWNKEVLQKAMEGLLEKQLVVYRSSTGIYDFRANAGVDVNENIEKKMGELSSRFQAADVLEKISDLEYELPKKYNQKYAITRYFQYEYLETEDFYQIKNSQYLFEEKFADGKVLILLHTADTDLKKIKVHLDILGDIRLVALVNVNPSNAEPLLLKYQAVHALKTDAAFIDGNEILLQELELYEEDLTFEINALLEQDYLPECGKVFILQAGGIERSCRNGAEFNNLLSEICEKHYGYSPRVNHELLNIEIVGSQYLKARNAVIDNVLKENDCSKYFSGTSPEAMVYRAAFVHTRGDFGCEKISEEIDRFFHSCAGKKQLFANLYRCLQGKKYGARRGIIPLFLAKKLADAEGTAVIYLKNKELAVSYETLNNVNEFPERYELYIEPEDAAKDAYLQQLEEMFCEAGSFTLSKQSRINGIINCMQRWYRALPQYTMVSEEYEEEIFAAVKALRSLLKRAEVNPRELLFERIPEGLGETDYQIIVSKIARAKQVMEKKLEALLAETAASTKAVFGVTKDASLKACLVEWYRNQSQASKQYILSASVSSFMNYLEQLNTSDEEEIVSRLSRILLDMYVEDWNDISKEQFVLSLEQIKKEVEGIQDSIESTENKSRLILQDTKGNEIAKYFDADVSDSTSIYLQNMIEEALEDFGDTLEMNQKVAVLVQAIEKLLQQ